MASSAPPMFALTPLRNHAMKEMITMLLGTLRPKSTYKTRGIYIQYGVAKGGNPNMEGGLKVKEKEDVRTAIR